MARLLPNWLEAYLAYTDDQMSPELYHLWSAIGTIASVMRRQVWLDMGYYMIYPNSYIILVSPPGRCKKSTAMRIARNMLNGVPDLKYTTDSTTRERLIQDMSQAHKNGQSAMTAFSSEFATMLTSSGMDMVVFLTDIFDSPISWSHSTKMGGTQTIKAPWLQLIGGTTPDWISRAMPLDTVGIGLTSRTIFVYADTPRVRPARPKLSEAQKELRDILMTDLNHIATLNGEYKFDAEADAFFEQWFQSRAEKPNTTSDPRLDGYFERKPDHMIKLAIILCAATKDELLITMVELTKAMQMLSFVEEDMPRVFAGVGKNPFAADAISVLDMLDSGAMEYGQILDKVKHSVQKEELDRILETLLATGAVRVKDMAKSGGKLIYELT